MAKARPLLQHLRGRPFLRRVLLSEALGPPRSRKPHKTARRPPVNEEPKEPQRE